MLFYETGHCGNQTLCNSTNYGTFGGHDVLHGYIIKGNTL